MNVFVERDRGTHVPADGPGFPWSTCGQFAFFEDQRQQRKQGMTGSCNQALNEGLSSAVVTRAFQKTARPVTSEVNPLSNQWRTDMSGRVLRPRHTVKPSTWSEQAARISRLRLHYLALHANMSCVLSCTHPYINSLSLLWISETTFTTDETPPELVW